MKMKPMAKADLKDVLRRRDVSLASPKDTRDITGLVQSVKLSTDYIRESEVWLIHRNQKEVSWDAWALSAVVQTFTYNQCQLLWTTGCRA